MITTIVVTNVFGDSKETEVYAGAYDGRDGFACPFCASVTVRTPRWPRCENPWCSAVVLPTDPNAGLARQGFINKAHEVALAEEEARRRREVHEWSMKRMEEERREENAWWDEQRAEAERRGACLRCFHRGSSFYGRRVKFVRHRKACPLVLR